KFKSKTLVIAADATYAPNEFIGSNGKTVEGMDPDLGKALAAVMGVKVKVVTHFHAGSSFYVKASGGPTINSLADICGHSVGVERGTTQAADATAQSGKCKSAGKSGVKVSVYPDQNAANLAISS